MPSSSMELASMLVDLTSANDTSACSNTKFPQKSMPDAARQSHDAPQTRGMSPAASPNAAPVGPQSTKNKVSRKNLHTFACEAGGLTMMELTEAMKGDARAQEHLTSVIADMLQETIARNDAKKRVSDLSTFEGEVAPITPAAYVRRIIKYGGCSPCCFVVGIQYLERLKRKHHSLCLTSKNFQRLFLVAIMEAAKYLDDHYYSNKHWAEVGGISIREINSLELEFLFRLNFNMTIQREEYDGFVQQLVGPDDSDNMQMEGTSTTCSSGDEREPAGVPRNQSSEDLKKSKDDGDDPMTL